MLTIALAAVIICFPFLSPYLPLGSDVQLAADWLGLSGVPGSACQVWGWLIFASGAYSTDAAVRLDVVSLACTVLSALCYAYPLYRLLKVARYRAESGAKSREGDYELVARLGTLLATLAFLLVPAFFFSATHASVRMTQFALPLTAIALLARLPHVARSLNHAYLVVVVGFLAAAGVMEGGPGLLLFPLIPILLLFCGNIRQSLSRPSAASLLAAGFAGGLVLVSGSAEGFVRLLGGLARTLPKGLLFDGLLPFLLVSVVPALALAKLVADRRMTTPSRRRIYFGLWTLAVVALAAATFASNPRDCGKAADLLVDRALADLGREDKCLGGDGTLDALILLKKPAWIRLVTTRSQTESADGTALSSEVATNDCLYVSLAAGCDSVGARLPAVIGWERATAHPELTVEGRAERWERMWAEILPLLRRGDEPGEEVLRQWFENQGNAIGELARGESKGALAERMIRKAKGVRK